MVPCVCKGSASCYFATAACPSSLLSSVLGPGCHTSSCSWWLADQSSQFSGRCCVPFCSPPPDLDTTSELSKCRDCFHTGAPRPESCVCPLPLLGCLSSSPPVGLCAVLAKGRCFHPLLGAHIENTTAQVPGLLSHKKSRDTKWFFLAFTYPGEPIISTNNSGARCSPSPGSSFTSHFSIPPPDLDITALLDKCRE